MFCAWSLQQLGLQHHANVHFMRFTMSKVTYTISYLLTMINDCQLSCMHQKQSHTSCNNYSWQILTSTLLVAQRKPNSTFQCSSYFDLIFKYMCWKNIQYVQFCQNSKPEEKYVCIHTHTHTDAYTHLYSHVIRHLAYGFNSC